MVAAYFSGLLQAASISVSVLDYMHSSSGVCLGTGECILHVPPSRQVVPCFLAGYSFDEYPSLQSITAGARLYFHRHGWSNTPINAHSALL